MLRNAALAALAGTGLLARGDPALAIAALGIVLALCALSALVGPPLRLRRNGPSGVPVCIGATTSLATAATGVSSVPVVPYLKSLDLTPSELVQAMGLSFTISTVALGANLALSGALGAGLGLPVIVALAVALAAMRAGSGLRGRLDPARFRRVFLFSLLALGLYLAGRGVWMGIAA